MCANCLSKLEIKVDIYPNMVLLVKTLRDNCWSICYFSLISLLRSYIIYSLNVSYKAKIFKLKAN